MVKKQDEKKEEEVNTENKQDEVKEENETKEVKRKSYPSNNAKEMKEKDGVIYFKATKKLTLDEHKTLAERIRHEMKETGLKIVLVPLSVDVEESAE